MTIGLLREVSLIGNVCSNGSKTTATRDSIYCVLANGNIVRYARNSIASCVKSITSPTIQPDQS